MKIIKGAIFICAFVSITSGMERCNRNCKNLIILKNNEIKTSLLKKREMMQLTSYPSTIKTHILTREIWRHITTGANGATTKEFTKGPYLPDEVEAQEWILRKKCKIGSICIPNGDCYGGGLQHCVGLGINPSWVISKDFSFAGSVWNSPMAFWDERCVQDWSCNIREHDSIVYVNEFGKPYINLGKKQIFLYDQEYNVDKMFVAVIKDQVRPVETVVNVTCILNGGSNWCHWSSDDVRHSVEFKGTNRCAQILNMQLCKFSKNKRAVLENSATIDDLNQISSSLGTFATNQEYNNIQLQTEIYKIKNVINKIVLSSSRFNPFILKDISGHSLYVQKRGKLMSACPCASIDNDCVFNEKVHEGDGNCRETKKANEEIDILAFDELEQWIPDSLDFRGKEENVYETEIEREASIRESFISPQNDFGGGMLGFISGIPGIGFFAAITSFLPYINLGLLLLRR